jgi:hypothetical protein
VNVAIYSGARSVWGVPIQEADELSSVLGRSSSHTVDGSTVNAHGAQVANLKRNPA